MPRSMTSTATISPNSERLRLTAHCDGQYSSVEAMMHEIFCTAPVGNGMITLHGDAGLPGVHRVDLALNLESVPVSAMAQLARRAKKNLPADLVSAGNVQGNFTVKEEGASPRGPEFQGRGEITNLRLQSATNKVEFAPASVPFVLSSGRGALVRHRRVRPFTCWRLKFCPLRKSCVSSSARFPWLWDGLRRRKREAGWRGRVMAW